MPPDVLFNAKPISGYNKLLNAPHRAQINIENRASISAPLYVRTPMLKLCSNSEQIFGYAQS